MSKEEIYEPTEEEVAEAMGSVAKQFGKKFEAGDQAVSEKDIVEKYKKEGWNLVDIITNAAKVSVGSQEGKDIKIVGLGTKFLVFKKFEKEEAKEE